MDSDTLGKLRLYRAVSVGEIVQGAEATWFANTGVGLRPYAPVRIAGSWDGSNHLTLTWVRRSRLIPRNLWAPALWEASEASEAYEADILSGSTVLRTLAVTAETATYTAAEQSADGLTPGNPVTVDVYHLSAAVWRGYPGRASV